VDAGVNRQLPAVIAASRLVFLQLWQPRAEPSRRLDRRLKALGQRDIQQWMHLDARSATAAPKRECLRGFP
jgi:hypothetical protein